MNIRIKNAVNNLYSRFGIGGLKNRVKGLNQAERWSLIAAFRPEGAHHAVPNVEGLLQKLKVVPISAFNEGLLERVVHFIARLFGFRVSVADTVNTICGRPATQNDFNQLLDDILAERKANPDTRIDFAAELKQRGLSTHLDGISFWVRGKTVSKIRGTGQRPWRATSLLKNIDFRGITFSNCEFRWVNLSGSAFENCWFVDAGMVNTILHQTRFSDTKFEGSDLTDAWLGNSTFTGVGFGSSNLNHATFSYSEIERAHFFSCKMQGTSFLNSHVSESSILDTELLDCLLFDTASGFALNTANRSQKPAIALLWSPEAPGFSGHKVWNALKKNGSLPVKVAYAPDMRGLNLEELEEEVKAGLTQVNQTRDLTELREAIQLARYIRARSKLPTAVADDLDRSIERKEKELLDKETHLQEFSIPMELMRLVKNSENSRHICLLQERAESIASQVDGIVMPGGLDVQPEFYGHETESATHTDDDYRRSILEFAFLDCAREVGIPLYGICRGIQIGNVYYGGTVTQDVPGHIGAWQAVHHSTSRERSAGIISGIIDRSLYALSYHHQANEKIGRELDVVLEYQVPKALESKVGVPTIFTQFHPEFKGDTTSATGMLLSGILSQSNTKFWTAFIDSAKTKKRNRQLQLEIASKNLRK